MDNKNYQYFCDTTYKCIPPTFHRYKLFVLSAYNLINKNIRINMFRNYFKENKASNIMKCIEYIKGRFGNEIDINEYIKKEINSAKFVVNINYRKKKI